MSRTISISIKKGFELETWGELCEKCSHYASSSDAAFEACTTCTFSLTLPSSFKRREQLNAPETCEAEKGGNDAA